MLAGHQVDRDRLQVLDAKILDLRRSLAALETEHASVRERLDAHKYPVLTLPNEVVSEIFVHFLPPYPLCAPTYGFLSPERLLLVCQKWRDIALSTPALWRAIDLEDGGDRQCRNLEAWLGRSGGYPLSISIQIEHPGQEDELLQLLVPRRARWKYFQLLRVGLENSFLSEGPLPLLRSLDIGALSLPATFPDMPRLHTVTLRTRRYFPRPAALLSWSQLTSLTLIGSLPRECMPIVLQTPNLHTPATLGDVGLGLVQHRDLNNLRVSSRRLSSKEREQIVILLMNVYGGFPLKYLLSFMSPALRRLQCPEADNHSDLTDILNSFISNSGCTIQELHIAGECETPCDAYVAAFPAIPKISFNPRLRGREGGRWEERKANLADFQAYLLTT
ncbi:hypothetical protein DFH06DRAFT_1472661 [Mycena polygramma]|nr:hypothetical protein DFH06DRAFT_1472661 [Mycena polygramma]